jgi:hypothetical protein
MVVNFRTARASERGAGGGGGGGGGNLPQVLGAPRNFLLGPSPFFWVKYFRA